MRVRIFSLVFVGVAVASAGVRAADLKGDYIEARTADVFTGPCFSNAEVFITGDRAVLAWKIREGSWKGVDLSGLCVAAAVSGTSTFSEDRPELARSVVIVDAKADSRQRDALVEVAKELAGARLSKIQSIATARMNLKVESHAAGSVHDEGAAAHHGMPQAPRGSFWASGLAQIVTRPLDERDHACGNEVVAYAPLSKGVDVKPAYTLGHAFRGAGLGAHWADPNCRSSFVGSFAL